MIRLFMTMTLLGGVSEALYAQVPPPEKKRIRLFFIDTARGYNRTYDFQVGMRQITYDSSGAEQMVGGVNYEVSMAPDEDIDSLAPISNFKEVSEVQEAGYKLYPNPSASFVHIEATDASGIGSIVLMDNVGRVLPIMEMQQHHAGHWTFSTAQLPTGVYIVRIANKEGGISHIKFNKL